MIVKFSPNPFDRKYSKKCSFIIRSNTKATLCNEHLVVWHNGLIEILFFYNILRSIEQQSKWLTFVCTQANWRETAQHSQHYDRKPSVLRIKWYLYASGYMNELTTKLNNRCKQIIVDIVKRFTKIWFKKKMFVIYFPFVFKCVSLKSYLFCN